MGKLEAIAAQTWRKFDRCVAAMESAPSESEIWTEALRGIDGIVPRTLSSQVGVWRERLVCRAWRGTAPALIRALNAYYRQPFGRVRDAIGGVREVDWASSPRSVFYEEFLEPQGVARSLAGMRGRLVVCVHRGSEDPRFTEEEIAAFDVLLSHADRLTASLARRGRRAPPPVASVELGPASRLLSRREYEVSELVCRRMTAREIGRSLGVSARTVESHIGHVYAKLGVGSRQELCKALLRARAEGR